MSDLETRLAAYIADEIALVDVPIEAETELLLSGAVDSLGVIRITQWIEDEADVAVDPGDVTLENFQSVSRMVSYISENSAA
ncbi:MAG: phosphopantetheine-binding protein [Acidimicrobiales bacterium]